MAKMTQAQVEQWIASNGGPGSVQYAVEQKTIKNPAYDPYDDSKGPQYVNIPVETWKNSKTGAVLSAKRGDDGDYELYESATPDPNKPATGADTRNPDQKATDTVKREEAEREAAERARNRSLPPGQDPRDETDAQRAARADATRKEQEAKAEKDRQTARQTGIDERQTATAASAERRATSQEARLAEEAKRPDTKVEKREINGQLYIVSVETPKGGGPSTIRYFGPDGAAISRLPSEGEATAGGPAMPDFSAYDSIESALIQYWNALSNDKSLTPQARKDRFGEAERVAQIATQNEATRQKERESERNRDYNVAGSKLTNTQNATDSALKFVSDLNGLLPAGSPLGGQAFAALLGLNILQQGLSGINNIGSASAPPRPLPVVTPAMLNDRAALEAVRQEIQAAATPAAAPDATAAGAEAARQAGIAAPAIAAPAAPRPAAPGAPVLAVPGAPPISQQTRDTDYRSPQIAPAPPISEQVRDNNSGDSAPMFQPAPVAPIPYNPTVPAPPASAPDFGSPDMRALPQPVPVPGPVQGDMQYGQTVVPVMPSADDTSGLPSTVAPSQLPSPETMPLPPGEVTRMPGSEWQALAQYQPQPMQQPQPQATGGEPPVAMLRAKIASTVPWRLTPEELTWAEANGFGEDAMRVPGRVAV